MSRLVLRLCRRTAALVVLTAGSVWSVGAANAAVLQDDDVAGTYEITWSEVTGEQCVVYLPRFETAQVTGGGPEITLQLFSTFGGGGGTINTLLATGPDTYASEDDLFVVSFRRAGGAIALDGTYVPSDDCAGKFTSGPLDAVPFDVQLACDTVRMAADGVLSCVATTTNAPPGAEVVYIWLVDATPIVDQAGPTLTLSAPEFDPTRAHVISVTARDGTSGEATPARSVDVAAVSVGPSESATTAAPTTVPDTTNPPPATVAADTTNAPPATDAVDTVGAPAESVAAGSGGADSSGSAGGGGDRLGFVVGGAVLAAGAAIGFLPRRRRLRSTAAPPPGQPEPPVRLAPDRPPESAVQDHDRR